MLLALLAAVTLVARLFAHFQTEWLWYHELGQDHVFWMIILSRWIGGMFVGVTTAVLLLANFWFVERAAPRWPAGQRPSRRIRRALLGANLGISVVAGVVAGSVVGIGNWQQLLLWLHRTDFGVTDPVFHRDVGFFVFSLPLHQHAAAWLFAVGAIALGTAFVSYLGNGAIRLAPRPVAATRGAHAHLLVLAALLLFLTAWRHRLSQFALELPREGVQVPAGYTDLHVQLVWLRALVLVSLVGAAALLVSAVRRSWVLPAVVLACFAAAELVGPGTLPALVQRYVVDPQTLARERPYIAREIQFTQYAYGLRDVAERPLPANATVSDQELESHRNVLRNVQLWDPRVLRADIDEHQSIGSFYSFPSLTVDRYREHGKLRGMLLSERELDLRRLETQGRTWANDRLAYTHGYGLVAVPAGEVTSAGRPTFTNSEFAPGTDATRVDEPRIYFGVQPPAAQPWVLVRTNRSEVEKPLSGDAAQPADHYAGNAGIQVGGLARRSVFALRFGELNFLISSTIRDHSRLVLHRDVGDRVKTLAPFLKWDGHPQVAVIGGRIQFLMTGYTASGSYPYSKRTAALGTSLNYLREAALATVDGFTGQVTIYATGTDPILRAWRAVFPSLFTPASLMPTELREHLRYPEELFKAQSQVWTTYHAGDVEDFYTRVDDWQEPADLSGPLDRVGSIRFRARADDAGQTQVDGQRAPRMQPSNVIARLPGEGEERFMLTTPFTPQGQENMTGYLAGYVDERGRRRLAQLTLPRSRLVLGPAQITRQILATPAVGDQLRLLNQETTDLGNRSISAVRLSELRVVPIGDSFLYVQPIYVTSAGDGVTRLRLVAVYLNGQVGYGPTLDAAIARAKRGA